MGCYSIYIVASIFHNENMSGPDSLHHRLYHLKTTLVAVLAVVVGVGLLLLARQVAGRDEWAWLAFWPLGELGSVLFGAGVIGVVWDYFDGRDREVRETARLRRVLAEAAPELRDAVIDGFVLHPEDLRRVAAPELLDTVAANALGLRLGDAQLGQELYQDLRDQALRSPERWHDVRVDATLGIPRVRSEAPNPFFDLLVRWQYTVVPRHQVRRFVAVSDRRRYAQLAAERGATSVWFKSAGSGLDMADEASFSLLEFSVDGVAVQIDRVEETDGQSFVVDLGEELIKRQEPVVLSFVYRSRLRRDGHVLHFDIDRPVKGFELTLNYQQAGIDQLVPIDYLTSTGEARVAEVPPVAGAQFYHLAYDDWLLPRAGVAFVWRLESETGTAGSSRRRTGQALSVA